MTNALVGAKFDRTLTADETTQEGTGFGLGDHYTDSEGNTFVYLVADAAITGAGYVVTYLPDFGAVMTATGQALTALGAPVAVAQAEVASGSYFWGQIKGFCDVQVSASAGANVVLAATSTAGQLDDAVGKTIERLVLTTARAASAGLAPAVLTYPTVGATTA
jgi:hypothetical protein